MREPPSPARPLRTVVLSMECAGAARLVPRLCADERLDVRAVVVGTRVLGRGAPALLLHLLRACGPRYVAWQVRRRLAAWHRPGPSTLRAALAGRERRGLTVLCAPSLREPALRARLRAIAPELVVCAIFPERLGAQERALASLATLNVHGSLLPRWRGVAPLEHALAAGDLEHGASVHLVDAGLDTGPLLARERFPLADVRSFQEGWERTMAACERALERVLAALARDPAATLAAAEPQPAEGACYAPLPDRATLALLRARGVRLD